MQLTDTQSNILFGILIVALLALNIYVRKLQTDRAPIGRAAGIMGDIRKDQKLIETFTAHWQVKTFPTRRWRANRKKIDFLPEPLRNDLEAAFKLVEAVNDRIDQSRRNRTDAPLAGVDLLPMKVALEKANQGMIEWLQANIHNQAYYPRRKSLMDAFRWGRR